MQNQVFVNEKNIICVVYAGDQTYDTVSLVTERVLHAAEQLKQQGKPVLILNSLKDIGQSSAGSRKAASEALSLNVYDKVALYGANIFFKYLAKLIIAATGKTREAQYFNTKEEAEKWLLKEEK